VERLFADGLDAETCEKGPFVIHDPVSWMKKRNLSRGFWIFFTAAFFFDFGFSVYFFLFNLYLLDLHFNDRAIGLISGAVTLGTVAGTLPAGFLARKIGLRPLLILCFIAAPVCGVLRTVAVGERAQISLAFLAGLAMCLWGVCFLPVIAGLTTEENRASGFSLIFSASIGTSALGGVICGYLPEWLNSAGFHLQPADVKRLILVVSCGIAVLGLLAVLRVKLPSTRAETPIEITAPLQTRIRRWKIHPFLLRFLPLMALWTAVIAAFTPFANVYLSRELHVPLQRIGLVFSAAQIVQLCVGLLTPILFRRLGIVNGVVTTQILTAVALAWLAGTQNTAAAVAMYLAFSAMQWMAMPGLYNLLMSKVPDQERSTASSMTMFLNAVVSSAATAGAGFMFARFGYPHVLTAIAVLALTVALLFKFVVAPADRRLVQNV
jgi:MFS family permease